MKFDVHHIHYVIFKAADRDVSFITTVIWTKWSDYGVPKVLEKIFTTWWCQSQTWMGRHFIYPGWLHSSSTWFRCQIYWLRSLVESYNMQINLNVAVHRPVAITHWSICLARANIYGLTVSCWTISYTTVYELNNKCSKTFEYLP